MPTCVVVSRKRIDNRVVGCILECRKIIPESSNDRISDPESEHGGLIPSSGTRYEVRV